MKINDFAGKSVEDQLIRLRRVQMSLVHRKSHYRSVFDEIEKRLYVSIVPSYTDSPDKLHYRSPDGVMKFVPSNYQVVVTLLNNATDTYERLDDELDKNWKAQRLAMKQSVIADPQAAASQIPASQVPREIYIDHRGVRTLENPYYFSDVKRYAGSPEGFAWNARAAVEFYQLKRLLAQYGMHFDVVYASEGQFLAVGGYGNIIYIRKGDATRLFLLGVQYKTSYLQTRPKTINRALQKIQHLHQKIPVPQV